MMKKMLAPLCIAFFLLLLPVLYAQSFENPETDHMIIKNASNKWEIFDELIY